MSQLIRNILVAAVSFLAPVSANAFETSGSALIVVDFATGIALTEKNADLPLPPASMSKIMTVYMVFEALKEGRLTLQHKLPVSSEAARYGGSTMFLQSGERVTVEDLLRGVIVLSGNDASAVLGEALSPNGTETGFARLMTERGREIGLTNSTFKNSNGWPEEDHQMSVRDLTTLTARIIRLFPEYYHYFAEREFEFDGRAPANRYNRNPLLNLDFGADGLKTGYTRDAGYGIVGSVVRGNRRVIFTVAGLDSRATRESEAENIVNWYFFQFIGKDLFEPGDNVVSLPIWMGEKSEIDATVAESASLPVPAGAEGELIATAIVDDTIEAPVEEGEVVGSLEVQAPGFSELVKFPLVANETVQRGGIGSRVRAAVITLAESAGLYRLFSR